MSEKIRPHHLERKANGEARTARTKQPDHSASLGDSITSSTQIGFSVHTGACMPDSQAKTPITSRGGAASLSQMPVPHRGSAHCRGPYRIRALDPAVHQVQPYS